MFQLIVPQSEYNLVIDGEDVTLQHNGIEFFRGRGPMAEDYADVFIYGGQ